MGAKVFLLSLFLISVGVVAESNDSANLIEGEKDVIQFIANESHPEFLRFVREVSIFQHIHANVLCLG